MDVMLTLLFLVIGVALLGGASGVAVSSIVAISEKRRLRKSVLGFLLVSFSTSLPELFVAINAILVGNMAVSLGDILGSDITNVCLVMGLSLIIISSHRFPTQNKMTFGEKERREFSSGLMMLSVTLLMLLYLQYISRVVGVALLAVFFGYSYVLLRKRHEEGGVNTGGQIDKRIHKEVALAIAGIAGVIIGARLTLESAIDIAAFLGIPSSVIGATLVAFGTSLPELAVDIRAAYRGYVEIVMGDIIGSCFLNSTLILGLLLTFTPPGVNVLVVSDLMLFAVVSNLLLWYFLDVGKMGRNQGLILVGLYLVNLLSILGIVQFRSVA